MLIKEVFADLYYFSLSSLDVPQKVQLWHILSKLAVKQDGTLLQQNSMLNFLISKVSKESQRKMNEKQTGPISFSKFCNASYLQTQVGQSYRQELMDK